MRPAHTLTTYRAVLTIDSKSRTRSSKSFVLSHTRGQFRGRGLFCQSLRALPFCPPVGKRSHLSEIIYHRVAICGVTIPLPRVLQKSRLLLRLLTNKPNCITNDKIQIVKA